MTLRAVALGLLLAAVMGAANAYLGLLAGMTVSASIPAAVAAMAILRAFRGSSIQESNLVQTAASAGEALAAGVIFTLPALMLLGYWQKFDYLTVTWITGVGGILGVLFTIPFRRLLIEERPLPFPEGTATAAVLRSGHGAGAEAGRLFVGVLAGAGVKLAATGLGLWASTAAIGARFGPAGGGVFAVGTSLSPALLGVGYVVGMRIAALVFAGGALVWLGVIPMLSLWLGAPPGPPQTVAAAFWSDTARYLGVGAMLAGGLWSLVGVLPSLLSGWRASSAGAASSQRELSLRWIVPSAAIAVVLMAVFYGRVTGNAGTGVLMAGLMAVTGFLFAGVAAYMAGLVGSSNNPVSGVTIATLVVAAGAVSLLTDLSATSGAGAAILVGAVVCCAAAIGGDNMQDLKAGQLVGSVPRHQQIMQLLGVIAGALVAAPVLTLLSQAYGFGIAGPDQPNALPAPQATLMQAVASGWFAGDLPWGMILAGAAVGAGVIVLDEIRRRQGAGRIPVLAVAVGMYLPFELTGAILLGGLVRAWSDRRSRASEGAAQGGLLLAAGLITGEALMGIFLAIPVVLTGLPEPWRIANAPWGAWPGIAALLGLAALLLRAADKRSGCA